MFWISLWAGKLYYLLTHKFSTTDRSGMVSLRLYDNFLKSVNKPKLVICVTGTNGKTTMCNFLVDMLTQCGYKVTSNREGANLRPGISKALTRGVTIFNKPKFDAAVLEFDELSSKIILPLIKPNYVVVTNIFRDTMKRNGHTEYVFNKINEGIPENSTLILNADDIISSQLGNNLNVKKIFFGIEKQENETSKICIVNDMKLCPKCNYELVYDFIRYHHIGECHCPKCGFKNELADYLITNIDYKKKEMTLNKTKYSFVGSEIFNIYNLLGAISILKELKISDKKIKESIKKLNIIETRYKELKIKDKTVITHFLKGGNSVSASRVFDYVSSLDGIINVILIIDDQHEKPSHGSLELMSYIYEVDYEFLDKPNIERIIVGGKECLDNNVRLLMSGVSKDKIFLLEDETRTNEFIDYERVEKIVILHDLYSVNIAKKIIENIEEDLK